MPKYGSGTTKLTRVKFFDSSTGFTLPSGADRSPDVSWVKKSRWDALTKEQKEKFLPLCPDFVIEIMSPNDSLKKTQKKMQEYIENGCRLGWLINRKKQEVEISRPGQDVEVLKFPSKLFPGKISYLVLYSICKKFGNNVIA